MINQAYVRDEVIDKPVLHKKSMHHNRIQDRFVNLPSQGDPKQPFPVSLNYQIVWDPHRFHRVLFVTCWFLHAQTP